MTTFEALGLPKTLLSALDSLGHATPTPIQAQAIPHVLAGRDVLGLAQTGTGKTAAFALPLVTRLTAEREAAAPRQVRALILAPTRELAQQIATNLRHFTSRTGLKTTTVVGGASVGNQIKALARGLDVLVATPGRLLDLIDRKAVSLGATHYLVLDEADQMLDLGFIHALRRIATLLPRERQTLLFSATMPKPIADLARTYLTDPVRIEVAPAGKAADTITQSVHFVSPAAKFDALVAELRSRPDALSLVFGRTKHGAEKLMKALVAAGFNAASIHGNKSQGQRDRALKAFRAGETRILVATDVAARGIDIPGVTHVYNYDLPQVPENYVHRIGRTGRAEAEGEAIAFCTPEEVKLLLAIERLMKREVPTASGTRPQAGQRPRGATPANPTAKRHTGPRSEDKDAPRRRRRFSKKPRAFAAA